MGNGRIVISTLALLLIAGQAFGVGYPISMDFEVRQGGTLLVSGSTGLIPTAEYLDDGAGTGVSNRHSIGNLGFLPNDEVFVKLSVSEPLVADTSGDRVVTITIDTGNRWLGPSLFDGAGSGAVTIDVTNMVWSTQAAPGVNPYTPSQYVNPDDDKPFFNMLGREGYLELLGSQDYPADPSVQVPMKNWTGAYTFSKTEGVTSAISLGGIEDPSGDGTPAGAPLVAYNIGGVLDHGHQQTTPGLVPEMEISLNYANGVPEPTTLLMLLPGLFLYGRRRRA